jgi:ABC-type transport system involved in multi-copper enzyme maturation permease subunit
MIALAYMLLSLFIVEVFKTVPTDDPNTQEGLEFLSILFPQFGWIGGANLSTIIFSGTGALSLFVGCMITASFIGSEQSCGYTKNFAGQLADRGYMAISKFVVASIAQIMILIIYLIVTAVFAKSLLGNYINGYDPGSLFAALGLRALLHIAITAVIVFICTLTKSHSIAMVVGSIFGIGITSIAYFAVTGLLTMVKIKFNVANYMPDGINGQLSTNNVKELAAKAIAVSLAFIVAFVAANYVLVRKRDVK